MAIEHKRRGSFRVDPYLTEEDDTPFTPEDACLLGYPVEEQEKTGMEILRETGDGLSTVLKLWPRSPKEEDEDTHDEMEGSE